jgi:RND family efflux transporter MFP subunit
MIPPLVRVTSVGQPSLAELRFTGVVSARVQSDLGFRVAGKITERIVDTGQTVHRGEPLMRMDRTDYGLAITALSGSVDAARAHAAQASADEERYRDLVSVGAVSASTYDQVKATAEATKAQLAAAVAQLQVATNEAGYSALLADADGTVVETLAEPGQVVTAGQTVIRLAHSGPREATIDLPETVRPRVGSSARATVFNGESTGSAKLRQLSDAAHLQSRTFEARYVLDGAAADAPLGSTVTIFIPQTQDRPTIRVPLSALLDIGQGPGVWILDPISNTVHWHRVQVGNLTSETALVSAGLAPGDRFVALGVHQLHAGEKVRPEPSPVVASR